MELVNLLAFIQIAVAFDFGLLLLSNTHGLRGLHDAIQEELRRRCDTTINEGEDLCARTERTASIPIRSHRSKLKATLTELDAHLSPAYAQWGKYSYLGLYAGIYGLIFLFLIGVSQEAAIKSYLLLSDAITLLFESLSIEQTRRRAEQSVSYTSIGRRLCLLTVFYLALILIPYSRLTGTEEPGFDWAIVLVVTLAVYMPMLVFATRIVSYMLNVMRLQKTCQTRLTAFKAKLP